MMPARVFERVAKLKLPFAEPLARLRGLEHANLLDWSVNSYAVRYVHRGDPYLDQFSVREVLPAVEAIVGTPLKPAYTFLSLYESGAFLRRHLDRPMCVWTVSLTIDAEPLERAAEWPLWIDGVPHGLGQGDAALFSGLLWPHWRQAMPPWMRRYANVYFHFHPLDYAGPME
jgi:hypothetical protein